MNRIIKFRVWEGGIRKMNFVQQIQFNENGIDQIIPVIGGYTVPYGDDKDYIESIFLMQYTGLVDREGQEIYEGDIDERGAEIVCGNQFRQVSIRINGTIFHERWIMSKKTVVCNIHENPELLK